MSGVPLTIAQPIARPPSQILVRQPLLPFMPVLRRLSERIPVLLFPVRLETRFTGGQLRVRIYPDQLVVETHEAQLTRAEVVAGRDFQKRFTDPVSDDVAKHDAWRALADRFGSPRAAWIWRQIGAYKSANLAQLPEEAVTPPTVRLLPDRFAVTLYKDGNPVVTQVGAPVTRELPLMRALQGGVENSDLFDEGSRWVWDYGRAVATGMAVTITLTPELQPPFSHLVVVGLRESLLPAGAATLIESWIDGQHYTGGFEFLEYGTPTNNTADVKASYSEIHDNPDDTYQTELVGAGAAADQIRSNGARLRRALGLPVTSPVFASIRLAAVSADSYAAEVQTALWPVTGGYFIGSMLGGVTSGPGRDHVTRHFVRFVRARGPFAALRIGRLPYGVLPVTRVTPADPNGWIADPSDTPQPADITAALQFDTKLQRAAWGLFGRFRDLATQPDASPASPAPVPRIGASSDPDAELLRILAMEPGSTSWNARRFVDERLAGVLLVLLRYQFGPDGQANAWAKGWVTASDTSRAATTNLLSALGAPPVATHDAPLLHILGWSEASPVAAPLAADIQALQLLVDQGTAAPASASGSLLYPMLQRALGSAPSVLPAISDLLAGIKTHTDLAAAVPGVSPFDLEGLVRDALDLCSHRVDAWITSLATKRLEALRAARDLTGKELPPSGIHIGAYGWVENLTPTAAQAPTTASSPPAPGYIHAPSVGQAAAAAVIRNAYLTHGGTSANPFQTDVSSDRVRLATWLLDGVRQGQPLSGLLGFQFERGLHEARLDRYIDDFRRACPLVAHTEVDPTSAADTAEAVAARNVVDGMQAAEKWRTGALNLNGLIHEQNAADVPGVRSALTVELNRLRDALDAVGDLLLTEGVFHAVQGNYDRAGAALEAAAGTGRPPEIDAVRTPVSGPGLRHRVCLLLPPAAPLPNAGPRTRAEPRLAAWVATLFRDVGALRVTETVSKTLPELGLEPIDLLHMSAYPPAGEDTELERWLRYRVGGGAVTLSLDGPGGVADLLERARHVMALIAESAPLRPDALTRPETAPEPLFSDATISELQGRVAAAQTALDQIVAQLDPAAAHSPAEVAAALLGAARFGIAGAVPTGPDEADLELRRGTIYDQAKRRVADSRELYTPTAVAQPPGTPERRIDVAQQALKALFGDGFAVLPVFGAPDAEALTNALTQNGRLGAAEAEGRVMLWLQQVAEIRKPVRRLEDVLMVSQAWAAAADGAGPLALRVAQLPYCAARPWQALSDDEIASRAGDATGATGECAPSVGRPRGVLSLVVVTPRTGGVNVSDVAGLLVDQWTETIPSDLVTTGVSFQYDAPGTQAPHALLLAVPGRYTTAGYWTTDVVRDIVKDTLDLAKVRLVDPDALLGTGGLLPGLFLPAAPTLPPWQRAVAMPTLQQWAVAMPAMG